MGDYRWGVRAHVRRDVPVPRNLTPGYYIVYLEENMLNDFLNLTKLAQQTEHQSVVVVILHEHTKTPRPSFL